MNIVLEKAEEKVNGVIKRKYGDSFIRGNNGSNSCNIQSCISVLFRK